MNIFYFNDQLKSLKIFKNTITVCNDLQLENTFNILSNKNEVTLKIIKLIKMIDEMLLEDNKNARQIQYNTLIDSLIKILLD